MPSYKLSRYNHFLAYPEGNQYLLYNAVSNGLARLEPDVFQKLRGGQKGLDQVVEEHAGNGLVDKLRTGHMIVDREFDEVAFLQTKMNISRFGSRVLSLTIVPTLYCNLDCVYCYEGAKIGKYMDAETEDALVDFVRRNLETTYRGINVSWFGGEPLMNANGVFSLSRKLIKLCREMNATYSATIVTNGTRLTKDVARRLKAAQVQNVQVTIDGPKAVHDVRRPYKEDVAEAGKSSFQRIVDNLDRVLGIVPITIRINVDKTNQAESLALVEWMQQRGWLKPEKLCAFYIGYTRVWTSVCSKVAGQCFTMDEFSRAELDFQKELLARGFTLGNLYPSPTGYCAAASPAGIVIDPGGELYKCWADVGNKSAYIGNVRDPLEINRELLAWLSYEPLQQFPECRACKFFPICASGCPYVAIKQQQHSNRAYNCTPWKALMRKKMDLFVRQLAAVEGHAEAAPRVELPVLSSPEEVAHEMVS